MITKKNIWYESNTGNYSEVLKSNLVDKVKDHDGWTPLHFLARKRVKEVLNHPSVDQVKDRWGNTPLHYLALEGIKETLAHSSVNRVKDEQGWTPLHHSAYSGIKEILNHPSVDKVKDNIGWTPLHRLARKGKVTKKDLKKLYPWYKVKGEITSITIDEILNTPSSIKFILGE